MNEIRDEIDRWDQLMESPDWDENTTAMWAMAEEIVRLREEIEYLNSRVTYHMDQKDILRSDAQQWEIVAHDLASRLRGVEYFPSPNYLRYQDIVERMKK